MKMLKRHLRISGVMTLCALMIFSFAACGSSERSSNTQFPGGSQSETRGSSASETSRDTENSDQPSLPVSDETDGKLNPPSWLIGSWIPTDEKSGEDIEVTATNVVLSSGNLDISWQIANVNLEVEESLENDVYSLEYSTGGQAFSYTFAPQDGGGMACSVNMGGFEISTDYRKK